MPTNPVNYYDNLERENRELRAALEEIEKWLSDGLPLGRKQKLELAVKARAAIAKAKGA